MIYTKNENKNNRSESDRKMEDIMTRGPHIVLFIVLDVFSHFKSLKNNPRLRPSQDL